MSCVNCGSERCHNLGCCDDGSMRELATQVAENREELKTMSAIIREARAVLERAETEELTDVQAEVEHQAQLLETLDRINAENEELLMSAARCIGGLGVRLQNAERICTVHGNVEHGAEAEELREGIEALIEQARSGKRVGPQDLQQLLDSVDARDSLVFAENETARATHPSV